MGSKASKLLEEPWRDFNWKEKIDLLNFIKNFKPSRDNVKHLHILLYGPVGAGKSSFINTLTTVLRQTSAIPAPVSSQMDESKSFTNEYKTYKIRKDQSDDCFPFVFTDTMGLEPLKDQGIHVEDLVLILKGHVRDGYKFNASSPLTDTNSKFYNPSPAPEDKVHLLVCVLPAHSPTLHSSVIEKIRRMRSVARDLNIPHVAVLTHCDLINTEAKANVQNIFHVKDILDKIREYGADVGFDENHFFPVRNYCMKYHQGNEGMDTLVLSTLKHMLNYADNFIHTL